MSKKNQNDERVCAYCKHFVWDSNHETGWCRDMHITMHCDGHACSTFERIY